MAKKKGGKGNAAKAPWPNLSKYKQSKGEILSTSKAKGGRGGIIKSPK